MIEGSDVHPRLRCVARQAFGGEAEGDVVNLLWCFVIFTVAGQTVGGEGREGPTLVVRVAALAADLQVGSFQGESSGQVDANARKIPKRRRGVAEAAVAR